MTPARGWCPACGRRLSTLMVDLMGTCPVHGRVAASFSPTLVVVNAEADELDVVGVFLRYEEDVVLYRRDDGTGGQASADVVDVVDAEEIGGEW